MTPIFLEKSKLGEKKGSWTKYEFQKLKLLKRKYSFILNAVGQSVKLNGVVWFHFNKPLENSKRLVRNSFKITAHCVGFEVLTAVV
jgi:hypothetical protein